MTPRSDRLFNAIRITLTLILLVSACAPAAPSVPAPATRSAVTPSPAPARTETATPLATSATPEMAPTTAAAAKPPAFPGAVGFGAQTPGGRGGRVIYVTNTNDSGEGSLRAALEASGPRIVIVNTSGTITLSEDLKIRDPYISIYGSKAPGGGVQIRGGMIAIQTHDVVIRFLKVRPGDEPSSGSNLEDRDAITVTCNRGGESPYNIVVDHSSLVWGTDIGGFAASCGAHDLTLSHNIMGEGIRDGGHPDGPHSKGMNLSYDDAHRLGASTNVTLYRNLITTSNARMPEFRSSGRVDMINNVVYNWGSRAGSGASAGLNLIGNTWRKGPLSERGCAFYYNPAPKAEPRYDRPIYFSDEVLDDGMTQLCEGLTPAKEPYDLSVPRDMILPADEAYEALIEDGDVGARLPTQDTVDQRLLDNVRNREGIWIDSPFDVGGWPELVSGEPVVDSDGDGMPDNWELRFGFHPLLADDGREDPDRDGYTSVEEYLNDTEPILISATTPVPPARDVMSRVVVGGISLLLLLLAMLLAIFGLRDYDRMRAGRQGR